VDAEILELLMNLSDLALVQRECLSVNQILYDLKLDQKIVVKKESVDVDLIEVLLEKVIVNSWKTSLSWSQV
jgi:phage antirepressor YoqD-like protein